MYFRETGQFKSKYKEELAAFPIFEDKIGIAIAALLAFVLIPISVSYTHLTLPTKRIV